MAAQALRRGACVLTTIEDEIRRQIRTRGLDSHVADAALHLPALMIEVLSGAVDDANRTFLASKLTKAEVDDDGTRSNTIALVFFRRQVLQEGDGFVHEGCGRAFVLDAAPKTTDGSVDLPPIALYFASDAPIVELTAETMDAIPRPRRLRAIEDEIPPRRKRALPV